MQMAFSEISHKPFHIFWLKSYQHDRWMAKNVPSVKSIIFYMRFWKKENIAALASTSWKLQVSQTSDQTQHHKVGVVKCGLLNHIQL